MSNTHSQYLCKRSTRRAPAPAIRAGRPAATGGLCRDVRAVRPEQRRPGRAGRRDPQGKSTAVGRAWKDMGWDFEKSGGGILDWGDLLQNVTATDVVHPLADNRGPIMGPPQHGGGYSDGNPYGWTTVPDPQLPPAHRLGPAWRQLGGVPAGDPRPLRGGRRRRRPDQAPGAAAGALRHPAACVPGALPGAEARQQGVAGGGWSLFVVCVCVCFYLCFEMFFQVVLRFVELFCEEGRLQQMPSVAFSLFFLLR